MATKKILIARHELTGGTKDKPVVHKAGAELDAKAKKALGLKAVDVERLVDSGAVAKVDVHAGGPAENDAENDALDAATKRADDAEGKLADETKRADDAEGALETANAKIKELEAAAAPAE